MESDANHDLKMF